MKNVLCTIAFLASISLGFGALGALAGSDSPVGKVGDPLPEKLAGYKLTGDVEKCFLTTQIRSSRPLDDYHLVFKMRNGDTYLNRLSNRCAGLRFEKSYAYSNHEPRLCHLEIIRVISTSAGGGVRGSCGLGKFEKIEKVASSK